MLKIKGIIILITSCKEEISDNVKELPLKIEASFNLLLSGKKTTLYKIRKV